MTPPRRTPWLAVGVLPVLTAVLVVVGATEVSASTTVAGSAYGFSAPNISLFGAAQTPVGPTPTVSLTSDASNSPQSGSATTGAVVYGPAVLFTSDAITVKTSGSSSSVQSTSTVTDINKASTQTSTGSEELTANSLSSTCSNSGTGNTGSTTATSATVTTLSGNGDPNPPTVASVPTNPAPNTAITGQIDISSTDTESFKFVFNEQSTSNGVLTVNAVDEYLMGPTAKGNLIIGQVTCGLAISALAPPVSVAAPATGSGGLDWVFGMPLAVLGAGVLVGIGVIERRRARARDSHTSD